MAKDSVKQAFYEIEEKMKTLENGGVNCIPNPIKSLRMNMPGIEKKHIYLITAASGCGKSLLTCYIFVFNAVLYAFTHRQQCDVRINYFALEESSSELVYKFMSFLCELSRRNDKNLPRITVNKFLARTKETAITKEEYAYVKKEYKDILDFFESRVYITDLNEIDNIEPYFSKIANENGYVNDFGYYIQNDPRVYNIIIYDHVGLLPLTKGRDLRTTIAEVAKISKNLRIKYGYTTVFTQQQNAKK